MGKQANALFWLKRICMLICMQVETFPIGMLSTNCYVASSPETKEAIVIDRAGLFFWSQTIFDYIDTGKLTVKFIVNTMDTTTTSKEMPFSEKNTVFQSVSTRLMCITSQA